MDWKDRSVYCSVDVKKTVLGDCREGKDAPREN
jgi:hypothetical protein